MSHTKLGRASLSRSGKNTSLGECDVDTWKCSSSSDPKAHAGRTVTGGKLKGDISPGLDCRVASLAGTPGTGGAFGINSLPTVLKGSGGYPNREGSGCTELSCKVYHESCLTGS